MDLIRARKVPEVIRRNGAEGKLPLPPAEIIEVLVFLSQETDHELQQKAFATLESWDEAEFCSVLADPATSPETLEFAAERLSPTREVLRDILLQNPNLPAHSTLSFAPGAFGRDSAARPALGCGPSRGRNFGQAGRRREG